MNFKTVRSILLLTLSSILILSYSCNGRSVSVNAKHKSKIFNSIAPAGEPVSEIVGGAMIIFQDKQNNYWFGGNDKGVYKYDARQAENGLILFTMKDGLCSNSISGIQEDQFGNIYFDTSAGVSKFDGQTFTTLEVINNPTSKNEWKLEPNDLWFKMGGDKKGPFRYDGESLYHLAFPKPALADDFYSKYPNASYSPYNIYTIYTDSKGNIWFGTGSLGVCRYDGKSISWLYEKQLTEIPGGGDFGIRSIIEDKDGYFWFCNTHYRYEILPTSSVSNETNWINYNRKAGTGKSNENDFPYFMSIVEDNKGDLWMATYDDGVWRSKASSNNEAGKALIHYPVKDGETDVLLFSIYKDNNGVLWLGTHHAGVYKFTRNKFEQFKA